MSFGNENVDDRIYGSMMMTKLNVAAKSDGGFRPAANVHPLRKLGTLLNFSENVRENVQRICQSEITSLLGQDLLMMLFL